LKGGEKKMGERFKRGFVTLVVLLALAMFPPWAFAQETPPKESPPVRANTPQADKWQVEVTPYFWAASLRGDVTIKGLDGNLNLSFLDLTQYLDVGGMAHVEVRKGDWGIFMDGMYIKLSGTGDAVVPKAGLVGGNVKIEQWTVELGGMYRVGQWIPDERKVTLDVLGGARYWDLKGTLDFAAPTVGFSFDRTKSKDWVDPFVGLRMTANLTRDFYFQARADVGGFGVGSSFSWNASGVFGYSFTPSVNGWMGYRGMMVNYDTGGGTNKFKYDVTMYGPVMGVGFKF
jgi:hypothetical protein